MFIFQKIKLPKINFVFFVIPILVFGFTALIAHGAFTKNFDGKKFSYPQTMREINEKQKIDGDRTEIIQKFKDFIDYEKYHLDKLGVNGKKQKKYFELLEKQAGNIENSKQEKVEEKEFKMPERPGRFEFPDTSGVVIKKLEDAKIIPQPRQKISKVLMKLVAIEEAQAMEAAVLPVIEDVKGDEKEIIISAEIRDLAKSLENNPVRIVNWVKNSITYEPYYGAKKGSIGCLKELVCNDVDASSLTISLLRASGIPARYKKTAAVFTVEQLRNLLGVAETKTAFAALAINKVPVYTLTGALDGVPLDEADFSNETYLVLEWTHVQAFYDYDERGANINNNQDLSAFADTATLRAELVQYHKKQWIPIDVIIKPYTHTERNILADQAGFNSENFWNGFFQYQGGLSPISKYKEDLLNLTGQNVSDNLSEKNSAQKNFEILPITLPYAIGAGGNDQIQIDIENFTVLPDARRDQVRISLRQESNNEVLLSHSFYGAQINNAKLDLYYEGATEEDKTIIVDYGGIHATPAPLVQIKPYLQTEFSRFDDVNGQPGILTAQIGEALILKFEHIVKGETLYEDEKFSVAGNSEGIFITLSKIQEDAYLDNLEDENRNSHLLLDGNATVAREYLRRIQEDGATLKKSLDYEYNMQFGRAVVTQNRILSKVDGVPTTFDFKGLSLDAGAYINDYSNRGNYKTHRKDFRLLWGQQASYMEAQVFKDVAGLDAISTVNGVQFAYAHPEIYTVHRITSENQAEVDGLQLSDNTKANMRADIAAGNVVLTPDKQVEDGNWRGTLYVSLRPDWTGQYAIGEQVGENGGWTINAAAREELIDDITNNVLESFHTDSATTKYIFREKFDKSIQCSIKTSIFTRLIDNKDIQGNPIPEGEARWYTRYGWPCLVDNDGNAFEFGNARHYFTLSTDGANFYSPGAYDYWETDIDIELQFKSKFHYSNNFSQDQCNPPMEWRDGKCFIAGGNYKMSQIKTYWGTYVYDNIQYAYQGDTGTIVSLGIYNPTNRQVYEVIGGMYKKYISADRIQGKYAPAHLGYPLADRTYSGDLSPSGIIAAVQQFTNGVMYEHRAVSYFELEKNWGFVRDPEEQFPPEHYLLNKPGDVFIIYGSWKQAFDQENGVAGIGYPESDAGFSSTYGGVVQKFESKVCKDLNGDISCFDREFLTDFKNGLEGIYDSTLILASSINLIKNREALYAYSQFVNGIASADDSYPTRVLYCMMYEIERILAYQPSYGDELASGNFACLWPESIQFYKSQEDNIRDRIDYIENQNAGLLANINNLQDAILTHVENASYSPMEWLGYFSVDIATMIVPVADISAAVLRRVAISVVNRYATELLATRIERTVLHSQLKFALQTEFGAVGGGQLAVETVDETVARSVVSSLKKAGSNGFTKGGNPVRWDISISGRSKIRDLANGVRVETELGRESAYATEFINGGKEWIIKAAFRGNITDASFYSSNVILDQYFLAMKKGFIDVNRIKLDKIVNLEAIAAVENAIGDAAKKQAFMQSPVGKMANWIVKDADKQIDNIILTPIIEDNSFPPYTKSFNAELILK